MHCLQWNWSTRVQEYKSTRVQEYKSTRVQEYKSTRVQEYKSTRVQEYNTISYKWGDCQVESCDIGYHEGSGVCQSNTRTCSISNGTGVQEYNTISYKWGDCQVESCDIGYHEGGGICESNTRTCSISNGTGAQEYNVLSNTWDDCQIASCNIGYHEVSGICESNTRTCSTSNGTGVQEYNVWSNKWGDCQVESCDIGYHEGGGVCESNTSTCSISHGTGVQEYNVRSNKWGDCQVASCDIGYHEGGGVCESNMSTCSISHGTGVQEYNVQSNTWDDCQIASCNIGYHEVSGICESNTRTCSTSNGTGVQEYNVQSNTWDDCQIASCDIGYHEGGGICESNTRTCSISNGTGVQEYNTVSYKWEECQVASCDIGYHEGGGICESNTRTCDILNGTGVQEYNTVSYKWGDCQVASCEIGYHEGGGICESNTRTCSISNRTGVQEYNLLSNTWDDCQIESCEIGYHEVSGVCESNTRTCSISNGTGVQEYNTVSYKWEECQVASCDIGYHEGGGICESNTRTCDILNGTGIQEYDTISYKWDDCQIASCNIGYHEVSGVCELNTRTCDILNGTGIQDYNVLSNTWGVCQVSSCDSNYYEVGGVCRPNVQSCSISNGEGTQEYDSALNTWGDCQVSICNIGYHEEGGLCQSNTRVCTTADGEGTQNYNTTTNTWGSCQGSFAFTALSIRGEFSELSPSTSPPVYWEANNESQVDRYEMAIGSTPGNNDLLDWTHVYRGNGLGVTFVTPPQTSRYVSIRALKNNQVLDSITSVIGYWESLGEQSSTQSSKIAVGPTADVESLSAAIVQLSLGVISYERNDIVDGHSVSSSTLLSGAQLVSGEDGLSFTLAEAYHYMSISIEVSGITYSYWVDSFSVGPGEMNLADYPTQIWSDGTSIDTPTSTTGKINILFSFIGSGFKEDWDQVLLNQFLIGKYGLFKTVPFKEKKGRFAIHYQSTPDPGNLIIIRPSEYDVSILVDQAVYSFVGARLGEVYMMRPFTDIESDLDFSAQTFVHEFGHAFGDLRDEYNYGVGSDLGPPIDSQNCGDINTPNRWIGIDDYHGEIFQDGCSRKVGSTGAIRGNSCLLIVSDSEGGTHCLQSLMRSLPFYLELGVESSSSVTLDLEDYQWSSIWGSINRYYLSEKLASFTGSPSLRTLERSYSSEGGQTLNIELDSSYNVDIVKMTIPGLSITGQPMIRSSLYQNRFYYKFSSLINGTYNPIFQVFSDDGVEIPLTQTALSQLNIQNSVIVSRWRGWTITPETSNSNNSPVVSHSNLQLGSDEVMKIYIDPGCSKEVGQSSAPVGSGSSQITVSLAKPNSGLDLFYYFYGRTFSGEQANSLCQSLDLSYKYDRSPPMARMTLLSEENRVQLTCGLFPSAIPSNHPQALMDESECTYFSEISVNGTGPSNDLVYTPEFSDSASVDLSHLTTGTYYLYVRAKDRAGNSTYWQAIIPLRIDVP